ncbi:MAG: hypothetical protein DMG75_06505 [Acidobacteria bacterium]|nr:MAG: hypothetical protein DMG75_06505 [Acidobacteriota bacterium]
MDSVEESRKQELSEYIDCLLNAWCHRRCLKALRYLLQAWPMPSGLADDWSNLGVSLKDVRTFARDELTPYETEQLERLIHAVEAVTCRES